MVRFVKFSSATDARLEVHINPDEVAAVRDSHGKTIILFRSIPATETVVGSIATVVAALTDPDSHLAPAPARLDGPAT